MVGKNSTKKEIKIYDRGRYERYIDPRDTKGKKTPARLKLKPNNKKEEIILIPKKIKDKEITFKILRRRLK